MFTGEIEPAGQRPQKLRRRVPQRFSARPLRITNFIGRVFMRNTCMKFIAVAALHVAGITAAQAQTPAGPTRPATVPSGYVITPFGYFHPGCVVHLAEGDELRPNRSVIQHANGTSGQMPACGHPHYTADGEAVYGDAQGAKDPNISHSWIIATNVTTTTSSFGWVSAFWNVPPAPASNDGQTVFFFPGLESTPDVVEIVQPVLGWNSDFASAWGIASWNCCVSGTTYEATPYRVSPGDTIYGYVNALCSGGTLSCDSWRIVTSDLENGTQSGMTATTDKVTWNWAFSGVLEAYNIAQCTDYPDNGAISFYNIKLENNSHQLIGKPEWTVTSWAKGLTPQCNYGATLPAQAILRY
jgi:hypothetical protein